MYCSFFGFSERPFTLTPNPAFIFLSRAHQEAFAHLIYGIENRCGFILLTGEVGAGKTTVIRTLLTELKPETHATALILNPMVSSLGLLRTINREFGISDQGSEPAELVEELHRFLLTQKEAGRATVLVIDEAQDMEPEVLEQVRLISNLETASEKLIQIILVGQPELEQLLSRPELRQLNQRITVRFHLTPMEPTDTSDYIRHRISTAAGGAKDAAIFSAGASKSMHRFAGGLPRLINAAADRALLIAYNKNRRQIDTSVAKQAIADVSRSCKQPRFLRTKPAIAWATVVLLVLAAAVLTGIYLPRHRATATTSMPRHGIEQQPAAVAVLSPSDNLASLTRSLAHVWNFIPPPSSTAVSTPEQAIQSLGLSVYRYTGNLGGIIRLGYPALLECSLTPGDTRHYLLLTGILQDQALVASAPGQPTRIPLQQLEQCWTGKALIPWNNAAYLPVPLRQNSTVQERERLVQLLVAAKVWPPEATDYTDERLRDAILRFQSSQGISTTGIAGAQTLMQLYRFSSTAATNTHQSGTNPMSHILDALQKLQEEKTAKLKQTSITGGILLDTTGTSRRPQKRQLLIMSLAAMLLLIGAALWFALRAPQQPKKFPKQPALVSQRAPEPVEPPALPSQPPAAQPAPALPPVAVAPVAPAPAPAPAVSQPSADDEEDGSARRRSGQRAAGGPPPQPTVATPPPPSTTPARAATPEGIKLTGIAWHDHKKMRRAVVNDLLVGEGAEVAGAKILEIRPNMVKFEKNGSVFEATLPH